MVPETKRQRKSSQRFRSLGTSEHNDETKVGAELLAGDRPLAKESLHACAPACCPDNADRLPIAASDAAQYGQRDAAGRGGTRTSLTGQAALRQQPGFGNAQCRSRWTQSLTRRGSTKRRY